MCGPDNLFAVFFGWLPTVKSSKTNLSSDPAWYFLLWFYDDCVHNKQIYHCAHYCTVNNIIITTPTDDPNEDY